MKKLNVHEEFIEALEAKISKKSELADLIADSLFIEKESAYRRLRGDVQFSFQEVITLAKKLNISLDKIMDIAPLKSRPFYLKLVNYAEPQALDYAMAEEYVSVLKEIVEDPQAQLGGTVKMFPDVIHLKFKNITRFYFFKWIYQYGNNAQPAKFQNVKADSRILDILSEQLYLLQQIKNSYLIFDSDVFKDFIKDVHYFHEIDLLTLEDVKLLQEDLMLLIDYVEYISNRGINEHGNNVEIYITNVDFDTGAVYIDSDKYKLIFIRCFTLHDITSLDRYTLDTVKQWMNALKRTSLKISESAEIQRKKFFNQQRKYVKEMCNYD